MKSKTRIPGQRWRDRQSRQGKWTFLCATELLLCMVQSSVQAQVVSNPANGHYYELAQPDPTLTCFDAKIAAQNRTYLFNGQWNDYDGFGPNYYIVEYEPFPYLFHSDFDGDGDSNLRMTPTVQTSYSERC